MADPVIILVLINLITSIINLLLGIRYLKISIKSEDFVTDEIHKTKNLDKKTTWGFTINKVIAHQADEDHMATHLSEESQEMEVDQ